MEEILFCTGLEHKNNEIFNLDNKILNRDNTLRPMYELKTHLKKKGIELKTSDVADDFCSARAKIFMDVPNSKTAMDFERAKKCARKDLYCIMYEPPATRPDNYEIEKHEEFVAVMTWNDELVDGKKYLKNNFIIPFRESEKIEIERQKYSQRKFMCMISANKYSAHPQQLYTARAEAVRWMERNHPAEFDLYGQRWYLPVFHSAIMEKVGINNIAKAMYKFKIKVPIGAYPSYRGTVESKKEIMRDYKFCICYENQKEILGYISEKIFDAFFAGCVPIYWGASNIEKYIPKECFVDMREFDSFEKAYTAVRAIDEDEFELRLNAIENFLNSDKSAQFKIDFFISQFEKMVGI